MEGRKKWLRGSAVVTALAGFAVMWAGARAQSSSSATTKKDVPPRPAQAWGGYPYPRETDAEIADGDVHRVLYADDRVMFLEVTNPPGLDVRMHGHPFASVFVRDSGALPGNAAAPPTGGSGAPAGSLNDGLLDPKSEFNQAGWGNGPAPQGMNFPSCTTSQPQAPHKPINHGTVPLHFYRVEFLRLDGEDIQKHWQEWYPEMAKPVKPAKNLVPGPALGPNFSPKWPYPIAYEITTAAPNNYRVLFEDGHLRFIEVTIRPGETTPMSGDPYPSVIAINSLSGDPSLVTDTKLDPESPLNGQGAGHAPPPKFRDMKVPLCTTYAPLAPHKIHNGGSVPLHYYLVDFKRVDGEAFAAKWRKWYPWMQFMQFMR
jgi:hypothetical protein